MSDIGSPGLYLPPRRDESANESPIRGRYEIQSSPGRIHGEGNSNTLISGSSIHEDQHILSDSSSEDEREDSKGVMQRNLAGKKKISLLQQDDSKSKLKYCFPHKVYDMVSCGEVRNIYIYIYIDLFASKISAIP